MRMLLAFVLALSTVTAQTSLPLVSAMDMVYRGAFRLPAGFEFAGNGLVYNAVNNSLFATAAGNRTAEITIPTPSGSTTLSSLPVASYIQTPRDATEGTIFTVSPGGDVDLIGGYLIHNGQLAISAYDYYDGSGAQRLTHWRRPLNLSTTGQMVGPFAVYIHPWGPGGGWVSGFMTSIPPEWRGAFGAPAMTGQCCIPIISRTSAGPAAVAFDPSAYPNPTRDANQANWLRMQLLYEPFVHPLARFDDPAGNDLFNGPTQVHGMVFVDGTRSILYFGRHGTGPYCYGFGVNQNPPPPHPLEPNERNCYDPVIADKGNHTYPYHYQVWAYDANDLLAVKNGAKQMWEPRPYAFWRPQPPFGVPNAELLGAAWDPATKRLWLMQAHGEAGGKPIIYEYELTVGGGTKIPVGLSQPVIVKVGTE